MTRASAHHAACLAPRRRALLQAALPLVALLSLAVHPAQAAPPAGPLADPPRTYEAEAPDKTAAEGVDRYALRVRPRASLWDIATEALPLLALEEGNARALELVESSFKKTYPNRPANDVRLNDAFVLEVPDGTFVTAEVAAGPGNRTLEYTSFDGDTLTEYRADPALTYRLVSAAAPWRERVMLRPGSSVLAVDIARRAYDTNPPDFMQVRAIRAALGESPPLVEVDRRQPHVDKFRNYRDRAVSVEPAEGSLQLYRFDPADEDNPFLAVEDAIGDEWDAGNFPRVARREYYRDGSVKRYVLTQPGDLLSSLNKPDSKHWASILPNWSAWNEGQVERLAPFAPAVNEVGSLLPGRLLVLVHQPKPPEASRGMDCLGIPLGLAATAGLAGRWWQRRRRGPEPASASRAG